MLPAARKLYLSLRGSLGLDFSEKKKSTEAIYWKGLYDS